MRSRLRLHDDDADAVRDHVVELARDPGALVGDCELRLLLPLALELHCALLEIGDTQSSPPQVAADEPRDREHQPCRGPRAARAERARAREVGRRDRSHRDNPHEVGAAVVAVRAGGIEGEQERQEDRDGDAPRVAHEQCGDHECARRGEKGRRRQAPPHSERQCHDQKQHHQDATTADHVQRRRRVLPGVELRPARKGERDSEVSPAVDHCTDTHGWNVLRLSCVCINPPPDPHHPPGLPGNNHAGRR